MINEGILDFIRDFFKSILEFFGVSIDEGALDSYESMSREYESAVRSGDFPEEELLDRSLQLSAKKMIPGILEDISILERDNVPAFFDEVKNENKLSPSDLLIEVSDQSEKYKSQIETASRGLGKLIGIARFIKEKKPDFVFDEPATPAVPADLIQNVAYTANSINVGLISEIQEISQIINFSQEYSQSNNFTIQIDNSSHSPSNSIKGDKGDSIQAAKEEFSEEEADISDELKSGESQDLPKVGVSTAVNNWLDSISPSSRETINRKGRAENLKISIFQAIDRSIDSVASEVRDAIAQWRSENEEALIKSKRFSKKNFDALESLVPQLAAGILKKTNENREKISRLQVRSSVFQFMNLKFSKLLRESNQSLLARILLEQEAEDNDPSEEIKASLKNKSTFKDSVKSALDSWRASMSPSSLQTLNRNQRGDSLDGLIYKAVDKTSNIVHDEVKKSIAQWRSENEEALIKSKRFSKKNFDSLESIIPDIVVGILQKSNESYQAIEIGKIKEKVFNKLNSRFYSTNLISESRWSKIAGI